MMLVVLVADHGGKLCQRVEVYCVNVIILYTCGTSGLLKPVYHKYGILEMTAAIVELK
jgi:hypothetical protein